MALDIEQITKLREKYGIAPVATKTQEEKKEPGYFSRLLGQYSSAGKDIISAAKTGMSQLQQGNVKGASDRFALRVGGAVAGAAFAPITAAVEPLIKPAVESALQNPTVKSVYESANALAQKHPESAKDIQNIFDIATLGLGGAVEKPIASAALKTAGRATELAGKTVGGTGALAKAGGKNIAVSAIRPTTEEAQQILNYEAKNTLKDRLKSAVKGEVVEGAPVTRGVTAFEKGLMGTEKTIGVQAKRMESDIWKNNIAPALKNSKEVLTKDELFAPVVARINSITDPMLKQGYKDAFDAIKGAYKGSKKWTLEEAQKLKEDLAKFTPEKVYKGKPIANELKQIQADMASAIREKIYKSFPDKNIKSDYITYGNLKNLEKVGVKAIADSGKKGGWGNFWTSIKDAAVTPVKTVGGQVVYRVGDKLEFVGRKGITKFGEYLKEKGYAIK